MGNYKYLNKTLDQYSTEQLDNILASLVAAETRGNEASSHVKFNENRQIGNKTIPKTDFPYPNPEFLNLKNAIIDELKNRNNNA